MRELWEDYKALSADLTQRRLPSISTERWSPGPYYLTDTRYHYTFVIGTMKCSMSDLTRPPFAVSLVGPSSAPVASPQYGMVLSIRCPGVLYYDNGSQGATRGMPSRTKGVGLISVNYQPEVV